MKQQIICRDCSSGVARQWSIDPEGGKAHPYPGETVGLEMGVALQNYRCDLCNESICASDRCAAYGISSDRAPWIEGWENDYIQSKEGQVA